MVPEWFVLFVCSVPAMGVVLGLLMAMRTFNKDARHQRMLDDAMPTAHPFLLWRRITSRREPLPALHENFRPTRMSVVPPVPNSVRPPLGPPPAKRH